MNEDQFTRIKQSPRQASTTDVEDLCDEIERLREHAVILVSTAEAVERERCAQVADCFEQTRGWAPGSFYATLRREVAAQIRKTPNV